MKSQYRTLFVFVVLLLLVSLACRFGMSSDPTQAPTINNEPPVTAPPEQPQDTQEPATVATDPPAQSSGQQFFTEEFDNGFADWSLFNVLDSKDTNADGLKLETSNSHLVFDFSTKYLYSYLYYQPYDYENVAVEARVENRGVNDNNISLVCRHSDEGWYEFNVANSGLYNILIGSVNSSGKIGYALLADGGSNKIKSGKDVNTYKIICKDRKLTLYINGNETRTVEDNQYVLRNGKVGISVSSFNNLPVKVEYDWVTISEP
jgi:hypothetical protein